LEQLVDVTRRYMTAARDPRVEMCNRSEDMTPQARYVGIGISSLDTPAGTWHQIQHSAKDERDVPGRCYAWLVDGSMLLVDRKVQDRHPDVTVWSTEPLANISGQMQYRSYYGRHIGEPERLDPYTRDTLYWLSQLHEAIAGARR
jgi:hypothetical protein